MRITLTLDDGIHRKLEAECRRSGRPFKQVVNEHLRRSLAMARSAGMVAPFRVEARDMGLRPGIDVSGVQGLLEQLDGIGAR